MNEGIAILSSFVLLQQGELGGEQSLIRGKGNCTFFP
jgi:hypothetical protein